MNRQQAFQHLGIPPSASEAEVKRAYRKMAAKHHPDKGGKEEDFKRIKEAYERITEPEKFQDQRTYANAGMNNADVMEEFLRRYNAGTTHRGPFDGFFTDRPQQSQSRLFNGQVDITLENAFKGATLPFDMPGCKSSVVIIHPGVRPHAKIQATAKSKDDESLIHVAIIEISIKPHDVFELDGNDLRVTISGPMIDFYTGTTLSIPDIEGGTIQVKLPPNSQPNTVLRLKGKGYNSNNTRGNMYVTVKAELPKLSEEQIEKLKELLK